MSWAEYRDWLEGIEAPPPFDAEWVPSWNVRPTTSQPILRIGDDGERELVLARWWFIPRWFKKDSIKDWKATTFNARIEKAATAPTFRASWKDRRCLVPAAGWYEWTGPKTARVPNYFSIETNAPGICFAGLWDRSFLPDDTMVESFTIMTTSRTKLPLSITTVCLSFWTPKITRNGCNAPLTIRL